MNLLRSPWKMPFTCSSTNSISELDEGLALAGTPEVAPRTTHQMKPSPTTPRRTEVTSVSTLSVQKPPVADRLREERQVVLDVFGRVEFFAGSHRQSRF